MGRLITLFDFSPADFKWFLTVLADRCLIGDHCLFLARAAVISSCLKIFWYEITGLIGTKLGRNDIQISLNIICFFRNLPLHYSLPSLRVFFADLRPSTKYIHTFSLDITQHRRFLPVSKVHTNKFYIQEQEWVSDCCLMSIQQFFSYIIARTC